MDIRAFCAFYVYFIGLNGHPYPPVASSIGWAHSRGRLHYSRHRQVDSAGGEQSETSHRCQQAGEGGPGVQPGVQLIAVY